MKYTGFLSQDIYGVLTIGTLQEYGPEATRAALLESIIKDFKKGDNIVLYFFISDKEISEEDAAYALARTTLGGSIKELNYDLQAYSEWTIMSLDEDFIVEGHDLFKELSSHLGKYVILNIDKV